MTSPFLSSGVGGRGPVGAGAPFLPQYAVATLARPGARSPCRHHCGAGGGAEEDADEEERQIEHLPSLLAGSEMLHPDREEGGQRVGHHAPVAVRRVRLEAEETETPTGAYQPRQSIQLRLRLGRGEML